MITTRITPTFIAHDQSRFAGSAPHVYSFHEKTSTSPSQLPLNLSLRLIANVTRAVISYVSRNDKYLRRNKNKRSSKNGQSAKNSILKTAILSTNPEPLKAINIGIHQQERACRSASSHWRSFARVGCSQPLNMHNYGRFGEVRVRVYNIGRRQRLKESRILAGASRRATGRQYSLIENHWKKTVIRSTFDSVLR